MIASAPVLPLAANTLVYAGVAAVFIVFALASSFYFPRRNGDYPGRRLRWFIAATVALFVATMASMILFAGEEEEHGGEGGGRETPPAETSRADTSP